MGLKCRGRSAFQIGTFVAATTLIVVAIALQAFYLPKGSRPAAVAGTLPDLLPRDVAGWRSTDLPLGPNETVRETAKEVLRYDDYIFRSYVSGGREFSVYLAHWSPGKMPTRLVAEHTPDRCWTENGWRRTERKFKQTCAWSAAPLPLAERGVFTPPGDDTARHHVAFWLLVDGRPYDFEPYDNFVGHAVRWWGQVIAEARRGPPAHLFVRIVSNQPFESLANDAGFQAVLKSIPWTGVRKRKAES